VRIVVTGEGVDNWACENIQEPFERMIKMTILGVNFSDGNPSTV
jgi:hypothetical protein